MYNGGSDARWLQQQLIISKSSIFLFVWLIQVRSGIFMSHTHRIFLNQTFSDHQVVKAQLTLVRNINRATLKNKQCFLLFRKSHCLLRRGLYVLRWA